MANPYHNPMHERRSGGGMKNPAASGKSGFKEKPGFPSASMPGKSQPRDRSNGVKRAKVYPKNMGL